MSAKRQSKDAREVRKLARNILAVYLDADEVTQAAGREWYRLESERCADFGNKRGLSCVAVAGAAAAISPGLKWEFVFAHVEALLKNPQAKVPTYSRLFRDRAVAILHGVAPEATLSGPKVTAFFRLLATAGGTDDVVVDGHAWNIATGVVMAFRASATFRPPAAARINARRYRLAAAAYREVADLVGEAPHAVQATTWIHWRNIIREKG